MTASEVGFAVDASNGTYGPSAPLVSGEVGSASFGSAPVLAILLMAPFAARLLVVGDEATAGGAQREEQPA